MTISDADYDVGEDNRLLTTLQRLLGIQSPELCPALMEASSLVAEALRADKVDVFLFEPERDSLVAMGTSDTEMGRLQRQSGLHRLAIANNGPSVKTFQTGTPYLNGRADLDPVQLPGTVERLGVRSEMDVVLTVGDRRRGIVHVASHQHDFFTERDLDFLTAVSDWIGMVTQRSELFEQAAIEAERRGRRHSADEIAQITRREREVTSLVAEGLTNAQIAERLVLAEGTVANYVDRIGRRLGLQNRTQIAVWAVEHGLYRSGIDDAEE